MTQWVYEQTREVLKTGKWPVLLGGDHSTPLGAIKAISEHYKGNVGILHIDAHADLRKSSKDFINLMPLLCIMYSISILIHKN